MNGIINIRNWIRTNGEMSEDGKSITYNCKELEDVIAEALRIHDVVGQSEQLNAFMDYCNGIEPVWAEEFRAWIEDYIEGV